MIFTSRGRDSEGTLADKKGRRARPPACMPRTPWHHCRPWRRPTASSWLRWPCWRPVSAIRALQIRPYIPFIFTISLATFLIDLKKNKRDSKFILIIILFVRHAISVNRERILMLFLLVSKRCVAELRQKLASSKIKTILVWNKRFVHNTTNIQSNHWVYFFTVKVWWKNVRSYFKLLYMPG